MEILWTQTYENAKKGYWGYVESVSGSGSTLKQTKIIRDEIPKILKQLNISSILDIPCGDFNWMRLIDLSDLTYIGIDIVRPLIEQNNRLYSNSKRKFLHLDVIKNNLPSCDLIICRDLLVHLSTKDIFSALRNFKKSGAKYLLTTTFTGSHRLTQNKEIESGAWRPINLCGNPFSFPEPILLINEQCTELDGMYSDKSLGLWKLETIVVPMTK